MVNLRLQIAGVCQDNLQVLSASASFLDYEVLILALILRGISNYLNDYYR